MPFRPVGSVGVAIVALVVMIGCAQFAAHSTTMRAVAAVSTEHQLAKAATAMRHSIASTEERLEGSVSAAPAADTASANHDIDAATEGRQEAEAPITAASLPTGCSPALAGVRGVIAADRAEDKTETAGATTDPAEDQGEAASLRTAIQAAAKACLPAQASRCTFATNALNALKARQALEDAAEAAHPLPAAWAQFEDQAEARIMTAAQNAVMTACAA